MVKKNGLFQKHKNLKGLLLILLAVFVAFLFIHKVKETTIAPQLGYKIYTNASGSVSLRYPESWTVKEKHQQSYRHNDNSKKRVTTTLSGKEGQVVIQSGRNGYDRNCDDEDQEIVTIQNLDMEVCNSMSDSGTEYWDVTSKGESDDHRIEVHAIAYPPLESNEKTIKTILSTLVIK